MKQSILFILAKSPQRGSLAEESLNAVLTGLLLDQQVSVVFVAEGINLFSHAQTQTTLDSFSALGDIQFYCLNTAIPGDEASSLSANSLIQSPINKISASELKNLIEASDKVVNF